MLPQKKSQLRRNACYRQQLLQHAPPSAISVIDPDCNYNSSHNHGNSATSANKPPANTESGIAC